MVGAGVELELEGQECRGSPGVGMFQIEEEGTVVLNSCQLC